MESRIELFPGVNLRAVQTDKFKTGYMSVNFIRPLSAYEAPYGALLPSVLLRGTESFPNIRSISSFLDEHYGASVGTLVRKKGDNQTVGFYTEFLEEDFLPEGEQVFAPIVDFLGEILFKPCVSNGNFLLDAFEGEKRNLLDTIDWRINDKRSYAVSQLISYMFEGEAYGVPRIGNRKDAESITLESLMEYYHDLLSNSRVELFYIGRRSSEYIAEILKNMLLPLPRGNYAPVQLDINYCVREVRSIVESLNVTQGKLCMGFRSDIRGDDTLFPAMIMLNAIFGSGINSKLFNHVRERLSLCYYASSTLHSFKGLMLISSGIDFSNYELAKEEILHQFEACKDGDISEQEFSEARNSIISAYQSVLDSPGRIEELLLNDALFGQNMSVNDYITQINAVKVSQIQEAAQRLHLDTVYFLKGVNA